MGIDYDLITVGGGLAGASLAKSLAEKGYRVLALEREKVFRDRVRGELVHPWGVAEARSLGIHDLLKETCAIEVPFASYQNIGLPKAPPRDMVATTPQHLRTLCFYHPEMQEVVLDAAERAGVHVQRGVTSVGVTCDQVPSVRVQSGGGERTYTARLVAGADGRTSACRNWAGFKVNRDPDRMVLTGLLLERMSAPDQVYSAYRNPPRGEGAIVIPLGKGRFRCYIGFYRQKGKHRLSGRDNLGQFIEQSISAGAPPEWFIGAKEIGPLASFDGAETWVDHPYRAGVVLVGDAATSSDPIFGCGLSLTLRDVRVLRDALLTEENWDLAAHSYAEEHDRYTRSLHRILDWLTRLFFEPGSEAEALRARVFPRLIDNPRRAPDVAGLGPEAPSDSAACQNLFGEDVGELRPSMGGRLEQGMSS